jgi:copper chaperone CopZ
MEANEQKKVVLMLEDLHCPDCAKKIGEALKNKSGVSDAQVFYTTSKAKVAFDPKAVKVEDLVKLIEGIGYGVKEVK